MRSPKVRIERVEIWLLPPVSGRGSPEEWTSVALCGAVGEMNGMGYPIVAGVLFAIAFWIYTSADEFMVVVPVDQMAAANIFAGLIGLGFAIAGGLVMIAGAIVRGRG